MNHNILFNRPTIRGWELRQGCLSFAHHACAALGLSPVTLAWEEGIQTAAIDAGGRMYLAQVADDSVIKRPVLMRYCGYIIHELLHRKYTNFLISAQDRYVASLFNAVEDAWIEHQGIDAGLLGNIDGVLTELIGQMVSEAIREVSDWSDPAQYPFALAIYLRKHAQNKVPLAAGLQPIFDEAASRLVSSTCSTDNHNIALWVRDQLGKLPRNPPQKPRQNPSDEPGEGDQGQGKGEGAGEKKNAPQARAPGASCDPREVEPTVDSPDGPTAGTYNSNAVNVNPAYHLGASRWTAQANVPAKLRYEVRRMFEDTATTQISPNRKTGAVNTRALHKFGQSDALFQLRRDVDGIDSAVVICIDVSSSMFDDVELIKGAVSAATALVKTLDSAGVKTALVTFGSFIATAAGFDSRVAFKCEVLSKLTMGGSTNDFAAIRHCHDLLRVRPEARKVCFVLTDGDGNRKAAKAQAEAGEAFGITTIGVGIRHNVSGVYKHHLRVDDMADLGRASLSQIKLAA